MFIVSFTELQHWVIEEFFYEVDLWTFVLIVNHFRWRSGGNPSWHRVRSGWNLERKHSLHTDWVLETWTQNHCYIIPQTLTTKTCPSLSKSGGKTLPQYCVHKHGKDGCTTQKPYATSPDCWFARFSYPISRGVFVIFYCKCAVASSENVKVFNTSYELHLPHKDPYIHLYNSHFETRVRSLTDSGNTNMNELKSTQRPIQDGVYLKWTFRQAVIIKSLCSVGTVRIVHKGQKLWGWKMRAWERRRKAAHAVTSAHLANVFIKWARLCSC